MVIQKIMLSARSLVNKTLLNSQICYKIYTNRLIHTNQYNFTGRLYTNKHEWVEINAKIGTIGISQYAQEALGDVVFAQLPDVDTILKQKDECGTLESVKAASEIYSPVSGRVIEKNVQVEEKPSLINTSCYNKGWLYKIELSNKEELNSLMNENEYNAFLKTSEQY